MSDYFVYYKTDDDVANVGIPIAITSHRQNINQPFLRIPHELGIRFQHQKETPGNWQIRWNPAKEQMEFVLKGEQLEFGHMRGFRRIPEPHETDHFPDIAVTWHENDNVFVVTGSKLVDATYRYLDFFVTENCDPNVLYFRFDVSTAGVARGVLVTCDVDLPDDFSIFTRMCFDGYLLRKES